MFSGAVKIGDLNDFIAPSQACVVSLEGNNAKSSDQDVAELGTVQLQQLRPRDRSKPAAVLSEYPTAEPAPTPDSVKISLHDCLACSGCVTSAETVLLQQQSIDELEAQLRNPNVAVAVTLSPQSVTSLAVYYGLPPREAAARLAAALRALGAAAVFDLSVSREVSLVETAAEFVHRYRCSHRGTTELASAASPAAGTAATPTAPQGLEAAGSRSGCLPMLASACPGWVCYAEKTHGSFVLPHISSTKSPQAVAGTLVKRGPWGLALAAGRGEAGHGTARTAHQGRDADGDAQGTHQLAGTRRLFHCAVMPCYDKKLEASREDFMLPGGSVPETDCVLATTEMLELLQRRQLELPSVPAASPGSAAFDSLFDPGGGLAPGADFRGLPGGSGGYLEYVFRTASRQLFGHEVPSGPLEMKAGRNADFRECWLEVGGRRVLRFASAYGFRNIQGLMRKIKLGKCEYDYVEVMACPAGCLNGGGQIRPAKDEKPQQLIERLEVAYHGRGSGGGLQGQWPPDSQELQQVYRCMVGAEVASGAAVELFHTQYHKREKSVTATLGDW